jgi:GNAT superfamily N-acetyltransferase
MAHPLETLLADAARGEFPPADGSTLVTGPPPGRAWAVVAFTAFHVVASGIPAAEVRAQLDPDDLASAALPPFLEWLAERSGRRSGVFDMTLAALGTGDGADLEPIDDPSHPRVARALHFRDDVEVYRDGPGTLILGHGLAGRREASAEVESAARGSGLGRRLARAAIALTPEGEPIFAQVAPGNAASVRAFLAAGFRPIGGEILFIR